ncbi:MAG: PTS glucose transporter subunit IIB [Mycoplasmatales bacterium]|nr:PTS glucose transporter subunit IIB [Mycoplasmatales bacterium]
MTGKDKFIYILLSIITLGIYPYMINKRKNENFSNELSEANKLSIKIEKLIEYLGGKENIIGTEYTHTKIKIFFNEKSKLQVENIEKLKSVSGIVASSKYITIIVGNQAKKIAENL